MTVDYKEAAQRIVQEDVEAVRLYMNGCGHTRLEVAQTWHAYIKGFGLNPLDLVQEVRVKFPEHNPELGPMEQWKWRDHCPSYAYWVPRWRSEDPQFDPYRVVRCSGPGHVVQLDETISALEWGDYKGTTLTAAILGLAHGSAPEIFSTLMMASLRNPRPAVPAYTTFGPVDPKLDEGDWNHTRGWFRERCVRRLFAWTDSTRYHRQSTDVLPTTNPEDAKLPATFPSGRAIVEHFATKHARLIAQWRVVLLVDQDAPPLVPVVTPEPKPLAQDHLQEVMSGMAQRAGRQAAYEAEQERLRQEQRDKRAAKKAAKKPATP